MFFTQSYISNDNTNIYMFITLNEKKNAYVFLIKKNTIICWTGSKQKHLPTAKQLIRKNSATVIYRDSLHASLNSHYKAWSYKKKKQKD